MHESAPIDACPLHSARLPPRLRDLPEPPERVFVRGRLPREAAVAVVGTRRPSPEAVRFTQQLAAALVRSGFVVASGGALGIDAAAHEAALNSGGKTLLVAPCGVRGHYPAEHEDLYQRVALAGAVLSPFAPDAAARQHHFFRRNACLAALSVALVVVEAPLRSGARNASAWARRLGRPRFAVPAAPWHERGRGCLEELALGAVAVRSIKQLMRELQRLPTVGALLPGQPQSQPSPETGLSSCATGPQVPRPPKGSPDHRPQQTRGSSPADSLVGASAGQHPVLRALDSGALDLDRLSERLGLPIAELQHRLLLLTLEGRVARDELGRFVRLDGGLRKL